MIFMVRSLHYNSGIRRTRQHSVLVSQNTVACIMERSFGLPTDLAHQAISANGTISALLKRTLISISNIYGNLTHIGIFFMTHNSIMSIMISMGSGVALYSLLKKISISSIPRLVSAILKMDGKAICHS